MPANEPTHHILMKLRGKEHAHYSRIGVGWSTGDAISLRLEVGVSISWRDLDDYVITLFPNLPPGKRKGRKGEIDG